MSLDYTAAHALAHGTHGTHATHAPSSKTSTATFSFSDLTRGVPGPAVFKTLLCDEWAFLFGEECANKALNTE